MGKIAETDKYISEAQDFAKPILAHIRQLMHEECPDVQEVIKWGFPCFDSYGYMCGMTAHKNHCSFMFHKGEIMKDPDQILEMVGKSGMGSLGKLKTLEDLPADEVFRKYIRHAVEVNASGEKVARPKPKKKADLIVPENFLEALGTNKAAEETFHGFSMSNQRDYVEWITEAKTEATRDRRMAQALQWMAEGKVRNWKYIKEVAALQSNQMTPEDLVILIARAYDRAGDPDTAEQQTRYMKGKFPYYGLKAPAWVAILKTVFKEHGLFDDEELLTFVRLCNDEECREMHYTGLQMLEKKIKKQPANRIDFLEECVLTNSWWDSVDWVNKLVGIHFKRYPDLQHITVRRWIEEDNIWLQRLAIIHQLTFRETTDWPLMQEMILRRSGSKEFFVQKAQGWALRQYSKTNGPAVIAFVKKHPELSPLTKREALKWLTKQEPENKLIR